jgi:cyclophilin family peptidyl-prolyl cis-trans isomerase/FKBP-type peptidyl-prolyl cis-trans isomerase
MKRIPLSTGLMALGLISFGAAQAQESDPVQEQYPPGLYAELTTPKGVIVLSLDFKRTPMTVANFVGLAEGTIRNQAVPEGKPFYNNTVFHRVAPGHVIQAGIPHSDLASTPGYSLPNEIHPELSHGKEGMVGMVNQGPHTGKCQFYITLGDRSYLDGDYTVFGEVYEGMDVVRSIAPDDPIETVRIVRVGSEAGDFRPTTESFRAMRREVWQRVRAQDEAQLEADLAYLEALYPHAVPTESGWSYIVLRQGTGDAFNPGDTAMVRYAGRTVRGMAFSSSPGNGRPHFFLPGESSGGIFPLVVGESEVNPGFDEVVSQMRRGERRLVIVPAEIGYDPVGFYARERPNEPRFVIHPRSILIYEVEVMDR